MIWGTLPSRMLDGVSRSRWSNSRGMRWSAAGNHVSGLGLRNYEPVALLGQALLCVPRPVRRRAVFNIEWRVHCQKSTDRN